MLIHVVQRGETLWGIAQRYGVSIQSIISLNQFPDPNQLAVGQAILVPTQIRTHVVLAGETLWRIAQRYGITVDAIARANQLTDPSRIFPGMILTIPYRQHTVQSGETLWAIANRYGVTVEAIIAANNIQNPSLIYPGTVLIIPDQKPTIDVNAYLFPDGEAQTAIVRNTARYLTYISPFAYEIQTDGGLSSINDEEIIDAALANNVVPMMSIINFTPQSAGSDRAHVILANPELQETLLTNMIAIMREKGYRGANIDFEFVYPEDKELYNQFLRRAVNRLHPEGYFVSTALAPKVRADQPGMLYEAHDYAAHGEIVDFVILMTYEWGYRLGPPRAISPINEIRRVLDYAVSVIPRNKIFMGFQIYARDWLLPHVQGQEAETFDMQEAIRRAIQYGATIQYDQTSQSPFYRYVDEQGRLHEVWFEDARSAQAKFDAVKEYGLRGISYWVLGYPFPQNWALLADNFTIRKRPVT